MVAQLVERLLLTPEVRGSNPISNIIFKLRPYRRFYLEYLVKVRCLTVCSFLLGLPKTLSKYEAENASR